MEELELSGADYKCESNPDLKVHVSAKLTSIGVSAGITLYQVGPDLQDINGFYIDSLDRQTIYDETTWLGISGSIHLIGGNLTWGGNNSSDWITGGIAVLGKGGGIKYDSSSGFGFTGTLGQGLNFDIEILNRTKAVIFDVKRRY